MLGEGDIVERAKALATAAHYGQVDKAGDPYINHLERVASKVDYPVAKAMAWLHDILEDTDFGLFALQMEMGETVANGVEILTRRMQESYAEYIQRIADSKNPVVIGIKLADLQDHLERKDSLPASLEMRYKKAQEWLNFFSAELYRMGDHQG